MALHANQHDREDHQHQDVQRQDVEKGRLELEEERLDYGDMRFIEEIGDPHLLTVTTFNNPMYNEEMRVADFLDEPHVAVIQALLLQFQPTFLDILPLYILMLVIFPVVLIGMQRHPLLVLLPSAALYIV